MYEYEKHNQVKVINEQVKLLLLYVMRALIMEMVLTGEHSSKILYNTLLYPKQTLK